jgi:hypothetical protein
MTKIYLKDWSAWTPNIKHKENWRVWAQNQPIATFDDQLNISDVPAMLRRRLSSVGKMAIACANDTEQTAELRPSLFCSRHGELARSIELLTSLANGELLSPTHFSLSVHNAIGGMLSINKKDPSNVTAIAAGENTVGTSLLEASMILQDQAGDEILCVIYDDPIPQPFATEDSLPQQPYALALILSKEPTDTCLDLSIVNKNAVKEVQEPQALSFLRFLLTDEPELNLDSPQTCYLLKKSDLS